MLRPSRLNPKISTYMQLHGIFDFNKTPIVPAGCKIIIYDRTNERPVWANHGSGGFNVGPVIHHFRNYVCYMSETKALQTSNTVDFFPTTCDDPTMTATETLSMIMTDLLAVLQTPQKTSPLFNSQTELATAITTIHTILVRNGTSEQTSALVTKTRCVPRRMPIVSNTNTRSYNQPTSFQLVQ